MARGMVVREKRLSVLDDESLDILSKCLTGRRLEVLRSIIRKRQSLGDIASELHVHRGFLTETVNLLQSQQIIRIVREGRRKVPEVLVDRLTISLQEAK